MEAHETVRKRAGETQRASRQSDATAEDTGERAEQTEGTHDEASSEQDSETERLIGVLKEQNATMKREVAAKAEEVLSLERKLEATSEMFEQAMAEMTQTVEDRLGEKEAEYEQEIQYLNGIVLSQHELEEKLKAKLREMYEAAGLPFDESQFQQVVENEEEA